MSARDPFRKLPHRPSDYGAAAPSPGEPMTEDVGPKGPPEPLTGGAARVPAPTPLEQFKAPKQRRPIQKVEKALLWGVSAQLVFMPWALGSMHVWAQAISFVLSAASFVLALVPRTYDSGIAGEGPFRLYTWPKLLRFPIFWLGVAFLGYGMVGALNPAWVWFTNGKAWWMVGAAHITWLPAGVRVPFSMWGPWRMLLIYATAWLSVCAVWIGFTRRRSFQALFTVLAANAFFLACFGIAERALGATKIFWIWQPPAAYFVSSFIYKNHAGAYFNLMLALCAGLAFWHFERSSRRLDKSSPSGLFAFFGTAVAMIIFFSYSRTATLLMFAFCVIALSIFARRHLRGARSDQRNWIIAVALVLALVAFIRIGLISLHTNLFWERMENLHAQLEQDRPGGRTLAAKATWDMASGQITCGWGAGSFRFIFPIFQQHYPALVSSNGQSHLYWEHAHNDYLELLAEYGVIGISLLLAGMVFAGVRAVRAGFWHNPLAICVLLGIGSVALHSTVDFNFFNPAILCTWAVLLFGVIRWVELENSAAGI